MGATSRGSESSDIRIKIEFCSRDLFIDASYEYLNG